MELTALDISDLRQRLASETARKKTIQYALIGLIALLIGMLVAALSSGLPPAAYSRAPLMITPGAEGSRALLDATYDDESLTLIVKGSASSNRALCHWHCATLHLASISLRIWRVTWPPSPWQSPKYPTTCSREPFSTVRPRSSQ